MNAQLKRDYVVVMDQSGSMATRDVAGKSRWEASLEGTLALVEKTTKLDPDGIDFYFFNNQFKRHENVTTSQVAELFGNTDPQGGTDLAKVLDEVLTRFEATHKPTTVLVVTDGDTSDRQAVAKRIIAASNKLETDEELAIQFIQIGSDKGATEMLQYFDDNLVKDGAKFDIVDTVTQAESESMSFTELLLKAIND